ncbi:MAG TPA: hypothetical protein VLT32_16590 [Candidatus Sulfomarinibacteraceae bacterium]|nr:hypothetical protein [Candidatus Sulfomarinibacteraceae bacterium]
METRIILLAAILTCFAAALLNALWFGLELRRFSKRTRILASTADLEEFKRVVGNQMRAALAQIGLLALPAVLFAVGLVLEEFEAGDILFIIVPSALVVVLAMVFRTWEVDVRSIRVVGPELAAERDAIVTTWRRKPLPDW